MTLNISLRPIQSDSANGDRLEVFPTVVNASNSSTTNTVTLSVDGVIRDQREVTVGAGNNTRVKLAWEPNVENPAQLPVTVSTSTDSDSDEATFREYNDVLRVRFNADTRGSGIDADESYVKDTKEVGPDAE